MPKFDGDIVTIKVKDITQKFDEKTGDKKLAIISEDGTKYLFREKKKDGGTTAAYLTYQQGWKPGDVFEVGYKLVTGEFKGDDGKLVSYKNNYVSFIKKLENTVVMNANGSFAPDQDITLEDAPF